MDYIGLILNLITLFIYKDVSSLMPKVANPTSIFVAYIILSIRYVIAFFIIYTVAKKACDRFGLVEWVPIVITIVAVVSVVLITHPWSVAKEMSFRIGGMEAVLNDPKPTHIEPTILKTPPFNLTMTYLEKFNRFFVGLRNKANSAKVYMIDVANGVITTKPMDVGWVYYILTVIIVVLTYYFISNFSRKVALILVVAEVSIMFGISPNLVSIFIIVAVLSYLAYLVYGSGYGVFAIYPLVLASLFVISIFPIPKSILAITLLVLIYLTLVPFFYIVGVIISGAGSIVEMREKFGLKVKPKKVIEEQAGEWDEVAIALILSFLFMLVIGVFGLNLVGVGTFVAMTVALFRRG